MPNRSTPDRCSDRRPSHVIVPSIHRVLFPGPVACLSALVFLGLGDHAALAAPAADSEPEQVGGDPEGRRNAAHESKLPRGPGLAAKFPDDAGIEKHPAVIFADGFEGGDYSRWDEPRNDEGKVLSLVDESAAASFLGRKSLRVTATLGKNTGGGLTKWFEPADELFIRFYTKFDPQCDYVHHFCTLRANKGLRGGDRWSGFGGAGLKPQGDERFSTALEPWGNWGRWPAPGRWNFYSYWHTMSRSPDGKYWGNSFRPAEGREESKDRRAREEEAERDDAVGKKGRENREDKGVGKGISKDTPEDKDKDGPKDSPREVSKDKRKDTGRDIPRDTARDAPRDRPEHKAKDIPKGRWICCEFYVKHNTPGKDDGEQAFWIDGELEGHWKGINWRKTPGLRANAFTLESYVTDLWTKNSVNVVYFDNVVIAREYIGPSGGDGPRPR